MEARSTLRVLVPVDGSKHSEQAIGLAMTLLSPNGTIDLVQVVPGPNVQGYPLLIRSEAETQEIWKHAIDSARQQLEEVAHRWATPSHAIEAHAVGGDPAIEILHFADKIDADLIVVASHGRGALGRGWFGSVADRIARTASIPVAIVRANLDAVEKTRPERLFVPYDGSALAASALPVARSLATSLQLPVCVVRAINPGGGLWYAATGGVPIPTDIYEENVKLFEAEARASLDVAVATLRTDGIRAEGVIVQGQPISALLSMIEPNDLVVLTSHGLSGVRRWWLGSVAEKLVRLAAAPVILVPAVGRGASRAESDANAPHAAAGSGTQM